MIIQGIDPRSIAMGADLLQMKMIVAVARVVAGYQSCRQIMIEAAHVVNKDGFQVTGDDVRIALEQMAQVVGYRTDDCVHPRKLAEMQQAEAATKIPVEDGAVTTPKDKVN